MSKDDIIEQVKDDPNLLNLMVQDTNSAPTLYKPTNFWSNYNQVFLPEIESLGLRDFRRRTNSMLNRIGAVDYEPYSFFLNIKSASTQLRILQFLLKMSLKIKGMKIPHDTNLDSYERAKSYGEKNGAKLIHELEASRVGNPENVFNVNGRMYTTLLLRYYVAYTYCCKFMNFDAIDTMMELGAGAGRQIEVIRKLHPHICFYLFEIPPQLYVCEQYLSALFPNSVVSYRQTRMMKKLPDPEKGKIFIFGTQKISELENLKYDLFWNADSLHEIEPDVVAHYLKYINNQTTKYAFLHEVMKGKPRASVKGEHGVLKQTRLEDYKNGLKDFDLQDISAEFQIPKLLPWKSYKFSFWKRK